jgi:tripartite-type tricarboxylate transporter receptor subunit TctC
MYTHVRRMAALAAAGAVALFSLASAHAQAAFRPTKPVRIVVPFGAGGSTDILARAVAEKLRRSMGQPFGVENRAGASGVIGIGEVSRAAPDGHTLLVTNTALLQTHILNPGVGYDPIKSFAPVAQLSLSPLVFLVQGKMATRSLSEFVAAAKDKPTAYTFGSAGAGQTLHLLGETLNRTAGLKLNHVPYKGEAPFINDLIGGHVSSGFASIAVARQHIDSGALRPLAVVGPVRSALLPNVPTFKESGLSGFELMSWFGLFAPAGTPAAVVQALHREVEMALSQADVKERLTGLALSPVSGVSPADFQRIVAEDYEAWRKVIESAGVKNAN